MKQNQIQLWLRFQLESDATFGRGDGIPGIVDRDVVLDEYGCPYLHGRTLKGLLNEICADLLFALTTESQNVTAWQSAADRLFGIPGSRNEQGILRVGHAQLPGELYATIRSEVQQNRKNNTSGWSPQDITSSLTTIRRQTALEVDGAPDAGTLRSMRVILRKTQFEATLTLLEALNETEQALLSACVKGLRRAGTARNRGRGRLTAWLDDNSGHKISDVWFTLFKQKVGAS